MLDLGETRTGGKGTGPMGFRVMSNLMRVGNYDDTFLRDCGTRLMDTERELAGNVRPPMMIRNPQRSQVAACFTSPSSDNARAVETNGVASTSSGTAVADGGSCCRAAACRLPPEWGP